MALDLQPVLDVQPATPGGLDVQPAGLDVQPTITAPAPINPNAPGGFNYGGAAKVAHPLTGPQLGTALATGGKEAWQQANTPLVAIPKLTVNPDDHPALAAGKEIVNLAAGIPEFFETPLGAATAGVGTVGGAVAKVVSGAFSAQMLHSLGEQAVQTYGAWDKLTPAQKAVAVTDMAGTGVFAAITGAHAAGLDLKPAKPAETKTATSPAPPETFSEFGDDTAKPNEPLGKGFQTPEGKPVATEAQSTQSQPLDVQPVETAPSGAAPKAQPEGSTIPEAPDTLVAQLKWLQAGKKPAVLFTHPEQTIPSFITKENDGQFAVHETPAGRFLYDTAQLTKDQIDAAVNENRVGSILGYGIDAKPSNPVGAVTIRDAAGREKHSVLTDADHLKSVFAAAQSLADEGDKIHLEDPAATIAARVAANTPKPTSEQIRRQQVRENVEAVKGLSGAKLSEGLDVQPVVPTELPPGLATPLVKVAVSPEEYSAARAGLRVGERIPVAMGLAQDAKRAQLFADTAYTERPGATEPMPAYQLNLGDEFKLNGQPVKVEEHVFDADTGQPSHVRMSGAFGEQAIPVGETVHLDKGSMDAKFSLDKSGRPEHGNYREAKDSQSKPAVDTVTAQRIAQRVARSFGEEATQGLRLVSPDLRDPLTARSIGLTDDARTALENTFGVKIQFLIANRKLPFGGFVDYAAPGVIWIDARVQAKALAIAGHELMHELRRAAPEIYNPLDATLGDLIRNYPGWSDKMDALYRSVGKKELTHDIKREELYADFLGEQMGRPEFWQALNQRNPGIFQRLANAALDLLNKVVIRLGRFGGDVWFKDLVKTRTTIVDALHQFADKAQLQKKLDADGTRFSLDPAEDERATDQKVQAAAGQQRESKLGQRIAANPDISEETKANISQWLYTRRNKAQAQVVADELVRTHGREVAMELFDRPPVGFPADVRSKLIKSIGFDFSREERQLKQAGDVRGAAEISEKAGAFMDEAMIKSEEFGQAVSALQGVTDFSPDAVVARTKRQLNKAAQTELNKVSDQITAMKQALTDGKGAGIEAVKRDAEVNTSARAAVDAAVKDSPEVHRAVVMELAPVWAQVPHILDEARRIVGAKANDILQKAPRPPGLSAGQQFRAIADDLAARAAGIFAGHIQGAEPGLLLVDKFMQRLGVGRPEAVKLATTLSKEWDRQLELAKQKLDKRIADQRARQLKREAEAQTDPLVDQAIRRQLREQNQKLGDALRLATDAKDALGKHIADRVLEKSGLKGDAADRLKASLQRRWDALVSEGQKKALDALASRAGVKLTPKLKSAFDKAVEIDRLGGLTDGKFLETVKTALKLKQFTAEDATKLKQLVDAAQSQPEGFLRDQAAAEVIKFSDRLKGEVTWRDVPMAIFYANVLSGFTTPAKIAFENLNLLASTTVASFLARPKELMNPPDFVRAVAGAYARGAGKGALQAAGTLRSGVVSGIWEAPRHTGVLEMKPFGEKLEALNFWKWFTRGISTAHELTFKPSWEIRQTMLAREVARKEGLSGKALDQRVANLLANTPEETAKARAQALKELPGGNTLDIRRRTNEILEQVREERMPGSTENARDFALRTAYLNEPYGLLGTFATAIRSGLEKMRKEFPVAGTAAKTQIPFTTVVANILNEKLNWTPVGLIRAAVSHKTEQLYGREIVDANERAELYAKALVGTAVIGATAELFGQHIHGNGPSDPNKRKQLQAAGWIPHSIEYHGRFFSYMNTPAALGLAVIGNTMDWQRYGHGGAADASTRLSFVAKATAQAIVSQGMLDSLKKFFEAIGSEDTSDGAGKLEKLAARTAGSFVVPNLVQQVDRVFDPKIYDAVGVKALVTSQIPFVRRDNKPVLNVLGEPIESAPFHYWESKATDDVLWRVLVAQQAFVPTPAKEQILGNPKSGPDFSRAMTPDEYYNWTAESGRAIRDRLTEQLDVLATSAPKEAQALVRKVAEEERAKTRPQF